MPYYAFPFAEADINRIVVPSNPGSAPPRRPGKKLRVEYLKDSLQQFPHLIRLVDGLQRAGAPLDRFERRCLDADSWHQCLQTCLESQNIPKWLEHGMIGSGPALRKLQPTTPMRHQGFPEETLGKFPAGWMLLA